MKLRMGFSLIIALAALIGCEDDKVDSEPCPPSSPAVTRPSLDSVDTLTVDNRTYILQSYLWRDFMPIAPPDGDPLRAIILLSRLDSLVVLEGVRLDHLWVVSSEGEWSTAFNEDGPGYVPPNHIGRIARCGPKWQPGISADVIVSMESETGDTYYLAGRGVRIARTD
jgi:hypothetical protein